MSSFRMILALAWVCAGVTHAQAHGEKHHAATQVVKEQKDWGIAGDARQARRTVVVRMGDDMRFQPGQLTVRRGDTLRLQVHNDGKVMHEVVIGTPAENAKHAELMVKYPNMEHDEPYMAHVPPGQMREIVWTFNRPGTFEFACLIAGHYQAGMKGLITVEP
ncbi:cupredoxin domain-containing protein [Rubrivivax albus]|uniref:Blue (type 1) copper domain-containing protein n=1 Tax=Rubrivivax albus TaxID=2499835 RepID=A0A437JUY4_9BURK|nr:cupredoxin family protein [Rubrivivax albus]RVT51058.1 hypothetical protein ENE75_14855 [Rubrivivax albus]